MTLTVSKGTYFVVEDYTNRKLSEVEAELANKNPNITLKITKKPMPLKKPDYIVEQSGVEIGEKLDPDKQVTINVTVSDLMTFKIEGIVGLPVAEAATKLRGASGGVDPILYAMSMDSLSDEEKAKVKEGVVVKVDPAEGTQFVQEIGSDAQLITIYYYE